jgi:hypothetical protein
VPSIEYDLHYLSSGLSELEGYLLSSDLYWPVGISPPVGEPSYPSLTIGNLLLAQRRLECRSMGPEDYKIYQEQINILDRTRLRWRHAWEQKAAREFRARLNLWRDFIDDYRADPAGNIDRYSYEVHRRVELEILKSETQAIHPQETEMLQGLDKLLRAIFDEGKFVWEPGLIGGFAREPYWFLYGRPKIPK